MESRRKRAPCQLILFLCLVCLAVYGEARVIHTSPDTNLIEQEYERQPYVVKRFLFNLPKSSDQHKSEETSPGEQSSQGNENGEKPAKSGNRFGEGIFVPVGNNKKVNLCDEKYIKYAEQSHITIKDTLVAACSGSSAAKWLLKNLLNVGSSKQT